MSRRSIYSRRQSMPAGTYDNPLADFLDALPQYINQYQQNQLAQKRYQDEIDYRNERNRIADERYNQELAYNISRQEALDVERKNKEKEALAKTKRDEEYRDTKLVIDSLPPLQRIDYLINRGLSDGVGVGDLTKVREDYKSFNDELRDILNIQTAGNPNTIAEKQLKIKDFNIKNRDNPLYTTDSNAFIEVNRINNKLTSRLSQISTNGYVNPKFWEIVNPKDGATAKIVYDKKTEEIEALIQQAGMTDNKVRKAELRKDIDALVNQQNKLKEEFKVKTVEDIESENLRAFGDKNMPDALSKLQSLMQMNPAGAQSMASAVSSVPSDIIPDQPAITDSEMDDVSNQIAMNQKQVEDNLAIINEDVPVVVDAQQPVQSPEIINEIQDTNELQDLPQDTGSNFILDRVLPDRVSATESVDGDESSLPPLDMGLEDDMTEQIEPIQKEVKQVSEFKSNKAKNNPAAFASDLGSSRNSLVKKLFNLLSEYEKADPSKQSRRLNSLSKSIQQTSKNLANKIGDFIDPQTGDFSDSNYTDKFYTQLSRDTGVSVSKLKDTLKRLAS
tara:strand:+ start:1417 stop:3099 length:1683 start_codon:yes stop_codon:yes gene_type:complete